MTVVSRPRPTASHPRRERLAWGLLLVLALPMTQLAARNLPANPDNYFAEQRSV